MEKKTASSAYGTKEAEKMAAEKMAAEKMAAEKMAAEKMAAAAAEREAKLRAEDTSPLAVLERNGVASTLANPFGMGSGPLTIVSDGPKASLSHRPQVTRDAEWLKTWRPFAGERKGFLAFTEIPADILPESCKVLIQG